MGLFESVHYPPDYPEHLDKNRHRLFSEPADGFLELICCPSSSGCRIIEANSGRVVFKVKISISHTASKPRFDVYTVTNSATSRCPTGVMQKLSTRIWARPPQEKKAGMSEPGGFTLVQKWRASASSLEEPEKREKHVSKRASHSRNVRLKSSDAANASLEIKVDATYTPSKNKEDWTEECSLTSNKYSLHNPINKDQKLAANNVLKVFHKSETVATAQRQSYAHLNRPDHHQPFLGVQVSENLDTVQTLLMLLLSLGWCEDTVHPADDDREKFLDVMRGVAVGEGHNDVSSIV